MLQKCYLNYALFLLMSSSLHLHLIVNLLSERCVPTPSFPLTEVIVLRRTLARDSSWLPFPTTLHKLDCTDDCFLTIDYCQLV